MLRVGSLSTGQPVGDQAAYLLTPVLLEEVAGTLDRGERICLGEEELDGPPDGIER
jgi:hypothetical protein